MAKHKNRLHIEHPEQEEELWLVSYADMVTLLFGFFVILYSFSTLDERKFEKLKEELSESFKTPESAKGKVKSAEDLGSQARQNRAFQMLVAMLNFGESTDEAVVKIEKAFQSANETAALKSMLNETIKSNPDLGAKDVNGNSTKSENMVDLLLPNDSLFKPGSADLTDSSAAKVRMIGRDLASSAGLQTIEVIGHTDAVGSETSIGLKNNFALSSNRAGAVAQALILGGASPRLIKVSGMASLQPIVPESDSKGHAILANRAQNRRVQILIRKRAQP